MTKADGRPYAELETITPQRAKEWLDKNKVNRNKRRPGIATYAAKQGQGAYQMSGKMASPATWGLAWVLFAKIDARDAEDFFEQVRTGDRLGRGDAVYALRRYLNDRTINSAGERRAAMAVIVKAWNAYRDGTRVDVLSFRAGGVAPEKMPEPK